MARETIWHTRENMGSSSRWITVALNVTLSACSIQQVTACCILLLFLSDHPIIILHPAPPDL